MYTCQNATLLEISCHGSNVRETQVPFQRMSILVLLYENINGQFHAVL